MRIDVRQNGVIHARIPRRMASQIAIFVPVPPVGLIADVLINMLQVRPARANISIWRIDFWLAKSGYDSTLNREGEFDDAEFFFFFFFVARYNRVQRISRAAAAAEFCN